MSNQNPKSANRQLDHKGRPLMSRRLILERLEVRSLLAADILLCTDLPAHENDDRISSAIIDASQASSSEPAGEWEITADEPGPGEESAADDFPAYGGLIPEGEGPADSPNSGLPDTAASEPKPPAPLAGEGEAATFPAFAPPAGQQLLGPYLPVNESPAASVVETAIPNRQASDEASGDVSTLAPISELALDSSENPRQLGFGIGPTAAHQHGMVLDQAMLLATNSTLSQLRGEFREIHLSAFTADFAWRLDGLAQDASTPARSISPPELHDMGINALWNSPTDSLAFTEVSPFRLGNPTESGSEMVSQLLRTGGGMIAAQVSHQRLVADESAEQLV
ncbi:MAG: hypothetical protein NXI32_14485, partial [bacterium]|nr:hypothetical protein [bacterium]